MKTNFKKDTTPLKKINSDDIVASPQKNLTKEEFEEFILKSGAKGSFMVYRSKNKDEELGIDEL